MSLLIKGVTAHTGLTSKEIAGIIDHANGSVIDAKIASGVGLALGNLLKLPVAIDGVGLGDGYLAKLPTATVGQLLKRGASAWIAEAGKFTELSDAPSSYTGQASKLVKVNPGETGLTLDLLLSFTDWYAGGVPTDFPWVFEANTPCGWSNPYFSPIVKNEIGQYIVYIGGLDALRLYRYNLTTKQWHRLADPPEKVLGSLALSPDGTKLAVKGSLDGYNYTFFCFYDIKTNSWSTSPTAPQIASVDVNIRAGVWADNDILWSVVAGTGGRNKCFKYTVSTTTWEQFTNEITPTFKNPHIIGISPDLTTLYFGDCGSSTHKGSKYVIATDTYTENALDIGPGYFSYVADRHKIWFGTASSITSYVDLSDESNHADIFPTNPEGTKPSNIAAGIFETSVVIAHYRAAEPLLMSYSGTGYWKLAEKVLTDYNLVLFKKPADGYAILAIDKVSGLTVPIYLLSTLTLPAGTWEFFYPKEGDYTQLVISGSELK